MLLEFVSLQQRAKQRKQGCIDYVQKSLVDMIIRENV